MSTINVDRIQTWIDQGRLDATKPITIKELKRSQCLGKVKDGLKLLAKVRYSLRVPKSTHSTRCNYPPFSSPQEKSTLTPIPPTKHRTQKLSTPPST